MDVSFLTHQEFSSEPRKLEITVQEVPFGTETSLWIEDTLCALGYGEAGKVLGGLKSHYPQNAAYFNRQIRRDRPKRLLLVGTPFQHEVWKELLLVPRGRVLTYHDVAKGINNPKAVRAVANAIGRNPISLHVPCHRVLRKDGTLGGYRWGVEIKEKILKYEEAL